GGGEGRSVHRGRRSAESAPSGPADVLPLGGANQQSRGVRRRLAQLRRRRRGRRIGAGRSVRLPRRPRSPRRGRRDPAALCQTSGEGGAARCEGPHPRHPSDTRCNRFLCLGAQMTDILMPRLSDTMEEGVISRWNVKVGDEVTKGDILGEIETDKATMDFEAYDTGIVSSLLVEEGATVAIGERVAVLGEDADDSGDADDSDEPEEGEESEDTGEPAAGEDSGNDDESGDEVAASADSGGDEESDADEQSGDGDQSGDSASASEESVDGESSAEAASSAERSEEHTSELQSRFDL